MQSTSKRRQPAFRNCPYAKTRKAVICHRYREFSCIGRLKWPNQAIALTEHYTAHSVVADGDVRGVMTTNVSDRLRDALERLDQAIDRLESAVSARPRPTGAAVPKKDNEAVARQLDLMIERLETALAD
jgi:hypothetical protein